MGVGHRCEVAQILCHRFWEMAKQKRKSGKTEEQTFFTSKFNKVDLKILTCFVFILLLEYVVFFFFL